MDDEGNPVQASIGPWYARANGTPFRYGGNRTNDDGRFTFADFMPGVKSGFNSDCVTGYTQMEDEGIVGEAGKVYPEKTFVLDKLRGSITGKVVDVADNPFRNQSFFVRTFYEDGRKAVQLIKSNDSGVLEAAVGRSGQPFRLELQTNGGETRCRWSHELEALAPDATHDLGEIVCE